MNSSKNGRWTIPFKKVYRLRVKPYTHVINLSCLTLNTCFDEDSVKEMKLYVLVFYGQLLRRFSSNLILKKNFIIKSLKYLKTGFIEVMLLY